MHVVCIDDTVKETTIQVNKWLVQQNKPELARLVRGTVYTIRGITTTKRLGIYVEEEINAELRCKGDVLIEPSYLAERFKPLKKLKVEDFMSQLISV
jgi:hypothetical protein